ncbi:MAG TPA: PIG-L family deacetylase [Terriglobia bacterium]|nr:PIG-L family deacetylase [Terriglobia bacterium]
MRNTSRIATLGKSLTPSWLAVLLAMILLGWLSSSKLNARPQISPQAVTDQITYNAGDPVRLRIIFPSSPAEQAQVRYLFAVRYGGEAKPVADRLVLGSAESAIPGYRLLWKAPFDARPGRYEIDMRGQDPISHQVIQNFPRICSFVVHRQVIQIASAEVGKPYYRSGDTIGCSVKIENLSGRPLAGLRLEFSERYWPWIAQQTQKVGSGISTLQSELNLKPHERSSVSSFDCTKAKGGDQETIRQYAAVVWDHARNNVLAIALTPLVFVNPPGEIGPRPYPLQYVYPSLDKVDTSSYRRFHPEPWGAAAIRFETQHTMFGSGSEAKVRFSLANPTDAAWRQVTVLARLMGPGGKELANHTIVERTDLNPHSPMLKQEVVFTLPRDASGLYHIEVQIDDAAGQAVATNELELGVNPLPKSVLVFCAHEDDDGTQMGFIRSLVENQIPLQIVYYTSGDAGSCDRYFQRSCGPAEALNFGAIRMQEARAAMAHLGVPPENISFLGLPDGGTGKIWYDHPKSIDPYLAVLLASDHAPYEGLYRTNLPFARDAVVEATEEIIKKFQPEVIFTVHPPSEGHIDHIVNNYFVVKALQELVRAGAVSPDTEVRVDRIFDPKSHPATPYQYEDHEFYVSGEAMALAQEAGWFYQSQGGNREQGNLRTWDQLRRSEGYRKVLDWKEHEGWNEKE